MSHFHPLRYKFLYRPFLSRSIPFCYKNNKNLLIRNCPVPLKHSHFVPSHPLTLLPIQLPLPMGVDLTSFAGTFLTPLVKSRPQDDLNKMNSHCCDVQSNQGIPLSVHQPKDRHFITGIYGGRLSTKPTSNLSGHLLTDYGTEYLQLIVSCAYKFQTKSLAPGIYCF